MKILAIGNSFSDDSTEYLYPVLKALGVKDISLGNLYIGGCPIQLHVDNIRNNAPAYEYRTNTQDKWETTLDYKLKDAVCSQDWEIVSMQQASRDSGMQESYELLDDLIAFVRNNVKKGVKLAWNITWAYQQDTGHEGFANYNCDQKTMYNDVKLYLDDLRQEKKLLESGNYYKIIEKGHGRIETRECIISADNDLFVINGADLIIRASENNPIIASFSIDKNNELLKVVTENMTVSNIPSIISNGTAYIFLFYDKEERIDHFDEFLISYLIVDKDYQKQGYGTKFLNAVI